MSEWGRKEEKRGVQLINLPNFASAIEALSGLPSGVGGPDTGIERVRSNFNLGSRRKKPESDV